MTPSEVIMVTQEKREPEITPRVTTSEVHMVTQEEINQMDPKIPMATHNTATKIEDEPYPDTYPTQLFIHTQGRYYSTKI